MAGAYGAVAVLILLSACSSDGDDAATATTAAQATTTTTAPSYEPVVEPAACDDEVPDDPRVECGVLTVPVDRADPGAGDVTIPYAILGTDEPNPEPDPIIYFSGGPGDSGRDIADFLYEIEIAGGSRDVIVFDQRGTGASTPNLDCPEYIDAVWEQLAAAAPQPDEREIALAAFTECRARLIDEGVVLDAYDTPTTALDIEDLRVALGIDEWNLFGVSYGTTVALEVVRQHPESARSVVLDSVYPTDVPVAASQMVPRVERALQALSDGCAADAACAAANGDVAVGLRALIEAWNADSFEATVEDAADGRSRDIVLSGSDIIAGLFNAMYDDELIPVLPSLLAPLLAREPLADVVVQQLATDGIDQLTSSAEGVAGTVDCADRVQVAPDADAESRAGDPFFASLVTFGERGCEVWDVAPVEAAFNEPVVSDVPALVFANEYDPITPPADSARAAEGFANGTLVDVPRLGHGAVFGDRCPTRVFLAFVDDPAAPIDTTCIATMGPPAWAV